MSEELPHSNVTTQHTEIGFKTNVDIIEKALENGFGICSSISRPIARYIWMKYARNTSGPDFTWGTAEILDATSEYRARMDFIDQRMEKIRLAEKAKRI